MYNNPRFRIAVLPGDGIGPEVVQSCLTILEVLCERLGGISFDFRQREGGAGHYEKTGAVFSDDTLAECRDADAVLLGAMGLPRVCYPDGTEVSAHFDLRMAMDIYAGLRPIRGYPRLPLVLADQRAAEIDLVVVREQSEGLLSSHGCGTLEDDRVRETMVVSRHGSRRVVEFAFELAGRRAKSKRRPGKVTCVDQANLLASMAFFRKVFSEVAATHPEVEVEYAHGDAIAAKLVRAPWDFDVLVTENALGRLLADFSAALAGSQSLAPKADIGDRYAIFQPAHGSADDCAGKGRANPVAQVLAAALMLDWLADQHAEPRLAHGARIIERAVDKTMSTIWPIEFGGEDGTAAITRAIIAHIRG